MPLPYPATGRFAVGATASCLGLAALLGLAACTDEVAIDSDFETPTLVVDAWLTDEARPQKIRLSESVDFFGETYPPPVSGAEVLVCPMADAGGCVEFAEVEPGLYRWTPDSSTAFFAVGADYRLDIELGDERYEALSRVNRVAPIDSIAIVFEEASIGNDEGLYAQVYARDLPGLGDRYLIRSTINDTLLNRPAELNLAADAAFDGGTASDGINFILPIRFGINKVDDDGSPVALEEGDRVEVEVWSLTEEAFRFLQNAVEQIENGESALFSVPVVSTRGNVVDVDAGEFVPGMFSVSAVSRAGATF